MHTDKISVIVPIYKVEKYVNKCIKSIADQTYKNLEIILVDDGSPDNCPAICDEWAQKDRRIRVIHKRNGGLSDARNAGLDVATGEFIMFVDSDDYIDVTMSEKLHHRLIADSADLSVCGMCLVDETYNKISELNWPPNVSTVEEQEFWRLFYYNNCATPGVVAWNKLYKNTLFDNVRFEKGRLNEDEFIIHKIISSCDKISLVPQALYYYLQRSNSIMGVGVSFKRIDAVVAIIERYNYFVQRGFDKVATKSVNTLMGLMAQICCSARMSPQERKIYRNHKKQIVSMAHTALKHSFDLKTSINLITFIVSERLFIFRVNVLKKIREKLNAKG